MKNRTTTVILLTCLPFLACGCAGQMNRAVEYRVSNNLPLPVAGDDIVAHGQAQLAAGFNIKAIETFRAAIRNSAGADAYNGLAIAYDRIGRPDLAQRYFEVAAAKAPGDQKYRNNLARFFERNGQQEMAENLLSADMAVVELPKIQIESLSEEVAAIAMADLPKPIVEEGSGDLAEANIAAADAPVLDQDAVVVSTGTLAEILPAPVPEYLSSDGILDVAVSAQTAAPFADLSIQQHPTTPSPPPPAPRDLPYATAPVSFRTGRVRIERISLGETRLITIAGGPPENSKFDEFGRQLATWLPQAIAMEQNNLPPTDRRSTILLSAVQRAQIEVALVSIDDDRYALADLTGTKFAYYFYPDAGTAAL